MISVRVELLRSRIEVQQEHIHRIMGKDAALVDELQTYNDGVALLSPLASSVDNLSGDSKMLNEQIEQARQNEISTYLNLCDEHCNAFEKRAEIYKNFADKNVTDNAAYRFDTFKMALL